MKFTRRSIFGLSLTLPFVARAAAATPATPATKNRVAKNAERVASTYDNAARMGLVGIDRLGKPFKTNAWDRQVVVPVFDSPGDFQAVFPIDYERPVYTVTGFELFDARGEVLATGWINHMDVYPNEQVVIRKSLT